MAQVILKVAYRPVRLAFCIKQGDMAEFRKAVYLSHVFWGGIFNPIVAVGGSEAPLDVAARHCVDILYALSPDADVVNFVNENNKSAWPLLSEELFIGTEKIPGLLDISNSMIDIYENGPRAAPKILPVWGADDPLADVFACTFGVIPDARYGEQNYRQMYQSMFGPLIIEISNDKPFPPLLLNALGPLNVCSWGLTSDRRANYHNNPKFRASSIFLGNCDDFGDLLAYWNLRASGANVIFIDERYKDKFNCWKNVIAGRTVYWTAQEQNERSPKPFFVREMKPLIWGLKEQTVEGTSDPENEKTLHLILPPPPNRTEVGRSQHVAIMIDGRLSFFNSGDHTLFSPGLPELSEYIGKKANAFNWKSFRVHPYGTDYIQSLNFEIFSLKPWKRNEVVKQALQVCGVNAKESKPGLIASRLIKQMNGIQQCRVFKIAGVRDLLKEYEADKSFTRSAAIKKICPNLDQYDFYLTGQANEKLTGPTVFDHLIDKGILRVGIDFKCPNCNLSFWRLLDLIKTEISCEFCGDDFNVSKQLQAKDCWKYRVSGLFSQHKDQQGAIPVTVTLQHVFGNLAIPCESIVATAMELSSQQNVFVDCESDFLFMGRENDGRNFLILGECKGHTEISLESVNKLKAVADSIPVDKLRTYLLFSKLSPFTPQELESFKRAQHSDYWRIILLSNEQLERSCTYDKAPRSLGIPVSLDSADEWAAITALLYYNVSDHLEKLRNEDGTFRRRVSAALSGPPDVS